MKRIHSLLLCCFICCWTPSSWALDFPVSDENVHINADRMNQNLSEGAYTAEGNVVVIWKGTNLTADRVLYSSPTHMIYATGSVVMSKESATLKGDTLVMNMDTGEAKMDSAVLMDPKSHLTITAEKLVRLNETLFRASSSELTTCDIPDPSWKFGTNTLNVNMQGYATGSNVVFYVHNVPVLYLPWLAFPVSQEKKSGMLLPRFGYSRKRGMQLDLPAYWVISPSQDLQFDMDIMSRRGVGTGLEYRYIRERGSEGHITAYSVYDQKKDQWRWQLSQEHKEIVSNDTNVRMTVNANSDRTFLNDFGDKSGDYNRQSNNTTINTLKTWQNYAATSYIRYNEDLYALNNRSTLQTLPSLGVAAVRQSIFSQPLYFDLDSSAENLYRETAPTGQRLYLFPRITLHPLQNSYIQTSLFAGTHIRGYITDTQDSRSDSRTNATDLLPEAGLRVSTSLTRIYDTNFQALKKIRHEIVPEISYSILPEHNQQRLPLYDYGDRIIHHNMITLSATSLLNGKFASGDSAEYRNISRAKLSVDYAFEGERRDLLTLVDSQRPWSNLVLESETWLTRMLRVTFDSRYDLYKNNLSTSVVGIEVDDRLGNSIGAGYQMARNEVEYFEGRLSTRLIKPLNLSYTARYSFDRGDFIESVYAAEYRHKCWNVNIAIHQRPGNQSVTVNFNLAGLGSR